MTYCFSEMCGIQHEHTVQNTVLHNAMYDKSTRLLTTIFNTSVLTYYLIELQKVKTSSLWQYAVSAMLDWPTKIKSLGMHRCENFG